MSNFDLLNDCLKKFLLILYNNKVLKIKKCLNYKNKKYLITIEEVNNSFIFRNKKFFDVKDFIIPDGWVITSFNHYRSLGEVIIHFKKNK